MATWFLQGNTPTKSITGYSPQHVSLASFLDDKTVDKSILSSPAKNKEDSFGACLMVKDDNDLLNEWLAYH
jgi:hypothetical protein